MRAIPAAFAVMGLLLLGDLAFLILRSSWQFSPWLDGWLVVGFETVACGLCVLSVVRRSRHRRVAVLMGAACFAWTIGDLCLTIESLGGGSPPTPSLADVAYLSFYPLALLAMLSYVREEKRRGHVPNWLDGAIAACGIGALCAALATHALSHLASGLSLASATNLTYVLGDLVLVGIIAGTSVVVSGRSRATLALIALGMSVNGAGDTFNFIGTGAVGQVVNGIAWPAALYLIAMSMWIRDDDSDRYALHAVSELVLPTIATCASLGILVGGAWHHFGTPAVVLATVTLGLIGLRLAFRPALRLAREQLRASEERYRSMFELNPQPMVAYDRETLEIVAISNAMIDQYGYSRDELCSMTIKDLQRPQDVAMLVSYLDSHPAGSQASLADAPHGYPGHHLLKDGTIIDVEVTSRNLELNGRLCRIAHFDDVTARNRAAREVAIARDQAVEASNMKSAFLANVSHEVRTPMNGVIGMTELLLDTSLSQEQREYALQVGRSGEQMLSILNDILDLSKIEGGHLDLDVADFDLHETINETCSIAGGQARAKGLRLTVEFAEDVPRQLRGDGRRLRQIVLNLVSNAVKFTSEGGVQVRVSAVCHGGGARVRVEVNDTGIGVDPDKLARMFEPFTQADVSTTRHYGGTGLGLAIVKEIVDMMGGEIGAASEPGSGSTFWFEVELATPSSTGTRADVADATAVVAAGWAQPPLVLIAEDSQVNQVVAARMLERCGCRAHIVCNGHDAIDAFKSNRYDIILMDCQMPAMDGYQTTAELRRLEAGAYRTPIIAMTAHALEGDRERCLAADMDDYLSKPMRRAELVEKLRSWVVVGERHDYDAGAGDLPLVAAPRV
jgi:PAS domain S-box-containing protein